MGAPVTLTDPDGNYVDISGGGGGNTAVTVSNFPATQPVSGTVTVSGGATAANQATMITGLNTNNTILNELNTDFGTPGDAAWSGTGNGTVIAILKAMHAELIAIKNNTAAG